MNGITLLQRAGGLERGNVVTDISDDQCREAPGAASTSTKLQHGAKTNCHTVHSLIIVVTRHVQCMASDSVDQAEGMSAHSGVTAGFVVNGQYQIEHHRTEH